MQNFILNSYVIFSSYKASALSFFLHLCSVRIYDLFNCGREIPFSQRASYSAVTLHDERAVSSLPSPYSHTTRTRPEDFSCTKHTGLVSASTDEQLRTLKFNARDVLEEQQSCTMQVCRAQRVLL